MNEKMYSSAEICERFQLKFSQLNYLVNDRIIPKSEIKRVRRKRYFTENAARIISDWKAKN
jgi:hypothetical protein